MRALDDRAALALSLLLASATVVVVVMSLPAAAAGLAVVGTILAHAGLLLRRSRPTWAFVLAMAGMTVVGTASGLALLLPSALTVPAAVHAVASHGPARGRTVVAALAVPAAALATWRVVTDPGLRAQGLEPSPPLVLALMLAVLLAAWSLGLRARAERERARVQLRWAQERERAAASAERIRIAAEMHDVIAHSLAVVVSQAKGGQFAGRSDPDAALSALQTIEEAGRRAAQELRGLLGLLDEDSGAPSRTPAPTLADLPALVDGAGRARLLESGAPRPLPTAWQLAVYRIVQESLTNVGKHGGEDALATVSLSWGPDGLGVCIRDTGTPGQGPVTAVDAGGGRGIAGMRRRVVALGGSLSAGPLPTVGYEVAAELPYPQEVSE